MHSDYFNNAARVAEDMEPTEHFRARIKRNFNPYGWNGPNFVHRDRQNKTKSEAPYSYSEFWHWRDTDTTDSSAVYSDRLSQWDGAKYTAACKLKRENFQFYGKHDCSRFLSAYFDKEIEATGLIEGCNPSNGYPYFIFLYREKAAPREAQREGEG